MKQLTFIGLLLLALFSSCRKDHDLTTTVPEVFMPDTANISTYVPLQINVTASIYGKVMDEFGNAIGGASVNMEGQFVTTDDFGRFLFINVPMNAAGTYIEVNRESYAFGATRFFPIENSENYIEIRLMPEIVTSEFFAEVGGIINIEGGAQISFQPNSILNANNSVYDGVAFLFARRIGPEETFLPQLMLGNMQGINEKNEYVALSSYGMVALELKSPNGELLHVDENKKASLIFQVSGIQFDNAPAEVSLWSFNRTFGLWQEQGKAVLDNGRYVGELKELNDCNIASPFPSIKLSGTLMNPYENPIANALVRILDENTFESAYAYTDNDGLFTTYVPNGKTLTNRFSMNGLNCIEGVIATGSYGEDSYLGVIPIGNPDFLETIPLTGNLYDCNDEGVNQSLINITNGNEDYCYYLVNTNEVSFAVPNCTGGDVLFLDVFDLENQVQSDSFEYFTSEFINIGNFEVCDTVFPDNYFSIGFTGLEDPQFYTVDTVNFSGGPVTYIGANLNGNYGLEISLLIESTGIYTGDAVGGFIAEVPILGGNDTITFECSGVDCGFINIEITEYGTNAGDPIRGTYEGETTLVSANGEIYDLNFTGEIKTYMMQ